MCKLTEAIKENNNYLKIFNVENKHSLGFNKSRISDLYNCNSRFIRKNEKSLNIMV
jgi:hypothetical protein